MEQNLCEPRRSGIAVWKNRVSLINGSPFGRDLQTRSLLLRLGAKLLARVFSHQSPAGLE